MSHWAAAVSSAPWPVTEAQCCHTEGPYETQQGAPYDGSTYTQTKTRIIKPSKNTILYTHPQLISMVHVLIEHKNLHILELTYLSAGLPEVIVEAVQLLSLCHKLTTLLMIEDREVKCYVHVHVLYLTGARVLSLSSWREMMSHPAMSVLVWSNSWPE